MPRLIVPGPHLQEPDPDRWKAPTVGLKALGLESLPRSWTPPFFVLTTAAYALWKRYRSNQGKAPVGGWEWLPRHAELEEYARRICDERCGLIVRSSAVLETLEQRGRYDSRRTTCESADLAAAVDGVWNNALRKSQPGADEDAVALVIQSHIRGAAIGHMSNERRVSKQANTWLCELELIGGDTKIFAISTRGLEVREDPESGLPCEVFEDLLRQLRMVAAASKGKGDRLHYEWVWDGHRLWIVQRDIEEGYEGPPPGSSWKMEGRPLSEGVAEFVLLRPADRAAGEWRKIANVKTFRKCNLPTPRVFTLEDPKTLDRIADGELSEDLVHDLKLLLETPIVIRSDVSKSATTTPMMLPRTETVRDLDRAVGFLSSTAREFKKLGLDSSQFCFILHRFILARAGALALSSPDVPRVWIDGTWGLVDGLNYYPYDSFEIDLNSGKLRQRIRSKTQYLDVNEEGNWVSRRSGKPWDWKPSLSADEIKQIGQLSFRLSKHLQSPVEVMYFLGVHPSTGHPKCLPWYYTTEAILSSAYDKTNVRFAGNRVVVKNATDLDELQASLEAGALRGRLALRLNPDAELVRSADFVERIASVALKHELPVELQGSVLSHVFYVLSNRGVRVRSVEPFEPRSRQRFGKLVRDLIPLRIESRGEIAHTFRVSAQELLPLLKAKVLEEGLELFWETDQGKGFDEAVDLLEVLQSIVRLYGHRPRELRAAANEKRKERGGFARGVVLVETQDAPLLRRQSEEPDLFGEAAATHDTLRREHRRPLIDVAVFREPRRRGSDSVVISLIPPDSTRAGVQRVVPLEERGLEVVVTYEQKRVVIAIRPRVRPGLDPNQILLF